MKTTVAIWSLALITALLTACGSTGPQGQQGASGAQGPQGPAATPAPTPMPESALQQTVDQYNALRIAQGQDPVTQGLTCSLYTVPNTTTQIVGATGLVGVGSFTYDGVFNQPNANVSAGLNVLPAALQPVVQTWFILKCYGEIIVLDDNWHNFDVASDDGSNLYIDGLLINNDGQHGIQDRSAVKFLSQGAHSFELDFFQGAGMQVLILNMDGSILPAANLYH